MSELGTWPALPLHEWQDTFETLHLWTQIVGKSSLALAPMQNHWWQVALTVSARGLRTRPLPCAMEAYDIEFDFIDHRLIIRSSNGRTASMALVARPVADFYQEYVEKLGSFGVGAGLRPVPVEMAEVIPFGDDLTHGVYDPEAAHRCWRVLVDANRVFERFRGPFVGKASPVHFFWGAFDLAYTRFSGRPAPTHPGGMPNCPDYVMIEAESHENFSVGWWPGSPSGPVREPVFYAYAYPEPDGVARAAIRPAGARYDEQMREFILPYATAREAPDPDATVLEFLRSTYEVCANLGHWDRAGLERQSGAFGI